MKCVICGKAVERHDPPRYDVFGPDKSRGPFCAEHFGLTETARYAATKPRPSTLDHKEV